MAQAELAGMPFFASLRSDHVTRVGSISATSNGELFSSPFLFTHINMRNIVFQIDLADRLKTEASIEILQVRLRRKIHSV